MASIAEIPFSPSGNRIGGTVAGRQQNARRWIEQGNAFREAGPASIRNAVAAYQAAIRQLEQDNLLAQGPSYRDDLASAWTNQGIAWLMSDASSSLATALDCFDRAIALREPLLAESNPWFAYNLAGVWLNRGDTLLRQGPEMGSVLEAYDRAIAVLGLVPLETSPLFFSRLALAWFNRGNALTQLNGNTTLPEAVRAFAESVKVAEACPDSRPVARLLPAAWAGKADALSRAGSWEDAWAAASHAIALVGATEKNSAECAILGLRCRLTLSLLASIHLGPGSKAAPQREKISAAIEAAETGLKLAARWQEEPRLAPLTHRLFQVAAQAYAILQPHFLTEFLDENLPLAEAAAAAPEDARRVAAHALATGIAKAARDAFAHLNDAQFERSLANFRELREAASRLKAKTAVQVT